MQETNLSLNPSIFLAETTDISPVSCEQKTVSTEIVGTYIKTLQKDFSDGYTVFYITCKKFDNFKINGKILCAGYLPVITQGVPLKLNGYFEKTKLNHYIFNVLNTNLSSNKKDITIEFILNTKIKGLGPKTAEKIVEITGPDIFSYIKQEDALETLCNKLPGIKKEKIIQLLSVINETHFEKEVFEFLKFFGGNYINAQKLFDKYRSKAIDKIKKEPYKVGRECEIPFMICDAIARQEGINPYNKSRINYLVISAMYNTANNGNTSSTLSDIYKEVFFLCSSSAFPETVIPHSLIVCTLSNSKLIQQQIHNNQTIYLLKEFNNAENTIASNIVRFTNDTKNYNIDIINETRITEKKLNISYSSKQKETFKFLLSSGFKILTGGPGTGKTTVLKGLIDIYKRCFPNNTITLCAPTGRAAQKLKETTEHTALTIHRLLNIKPYKVNDTDYTDVTPLKKGLIIIDEMSMVSTKLFAYITSAIQSHSTVILCGDTFQLPSVEAGNVFQDLISLNKFETVMLDIIHRQQNGSDIISLSQCIKNGDVSEFIKPTKSTSNNIKKIYNSKEVQIIEAQSQEDILDIVLKTLGKTFFNKNSHYYIDNLLDLQILSSTKKNTVGTVSLNKQIKNIYQSNSEKEQTGFSIGDKIMMVENNYDIGYYNGDIGFIKDFNPIQNSVIVELDGNEMEIPYKNIKDICLSYACTVHKSQGSEYKYVIIVLPKEPISMLQRNLLYTAVTRTKKYVAIVYEKNAFQTAVNCNKIIDRRTNLKEKLIAKFS